MRQFRDAWKYILSEQETRDTFLLLLAMALFLSVAAVQALEQEQAEPLFTVWKFQISREVSIGAVGSMLIVVFQISRWGRKTLAKMTAEARKVAHLPAEVDKVRADIGELRAAIAEINARCVLRAPEEMGEPR
jgi:hypothetical protein